MVGYGPEDNHFVVELTYNYGIKKYSLGNDFQVSGSPPPSPYPVYFTCTIASICNSSTIRVVSNPLRLQNTLPKILNKNIIMSRENAFK